MKTLKESILSSTNTGINFHNGMECLAYSKHPKAVELRKAFSVEKSETPEGFVFTNNGCTDLENKGIKGVYLWVSYKPSKASLLSKKLHHFAYKVKWEMEGIFRKMGKIEEYIINSTDMYRIYIEL